jgi:hypothetical protein
MATTLVLAPAGCSLGGDEEPQPAAGAPREIGEVVHELERATARRDFDTICRDLFTTDAHERAGGAGCPRRLRSAADGIQEPTISLRAIDLEGQRPTVRVRTRVRGQATVGAVLELRRDQGEWRIDALGGRG